MEPRCNDIFQTGAVVQRGFAVRELGKHLFPSGLCLSLDTLALRRQDPQLCVSVGSWGSYVPVDRSSFKAVTAAARPRWLEMSHRLQEVLKSGRTNPSFLIKYAKVMMSISGSLS